MNLGPSTCVFLLRQARSILGFRRKADSQGNLTKCRGVLWPSDSIQPRGSSNSHNCFVIMITCGSFAHMQLHF